MCRHMPAAATEVRPGYSAGLGAGIGCVAFLEETCDAFFVIIGLKQPGQVL